MAAPAFVGAGTGIAGTGTNITVTRTATVGNLIIAHQLIDSANNEGAIAAGTTGVENLAGTDNTMTTLTPLDGFQVGNPWAASQAIFLGRAISTSVSVVLGGGTGGDHFGRLYEFSGVHAGTATSDVIENGSAGSTANTFGTSTTVADTGVTTLGADRLALNFVGINDDLTGLAAFAGATFTWTMDAFFESSTGTDATIALMTATPTSGGVVNGGSDTITSDGWGVVGFALIPEASAAPASAPLPNRNLQVIRR